MCINIMVSLILMAITPCQIMVQFAQRVILFALFQDSYPMDYLYYF